MVGEGERVCTIVFRLANGADAGDRPSRPSTPRLPTARPLPSRILGFLISYLEVDTSVRTEYDNIRTRFRVRRDIASPLEVTVTKTNIQK